MTIWTMVLLIAGGCVSYGRQIPSDLVKSLTVEVTTRGDVIALFGEPPERQAAGRTETWAYACARNSGFGSRSERLGLGFEKDLPVTCRFDTFELDHLGRPVGSASVACGPR